MQPTDAPDTSDLATLDFYAREAPVYAASGYGGVSRWLHDFMLLLPAGARILELGCGGGRDAVQPTDAPDTSDLTTLDFYAREAPVYAASGYGGVSRWLHDFMLLLPAGARILELGCGGGRDAEAMLGHGFDVHPTDGTPAMARKAEQRLGRAVGVMRFDELSDIAEYDAVWANASLLHVPRAGLGHVLALIHRALKPGGLHFASYKAGGVAGRDGLGRYFNYPDRQALMDAYSSSGPWEIVSVVEYVGGGYDGRQGPWIAITVRKPLG